MSNPMESSLKESNGKILMTPPVRRIVGDGLLRIPFDSINRKEEMNRNTTFTGSTISSQFVKQESIGKSENEKRIVLRERSTSSSTCSSNNDSLRSFSPDLSLNEDDDGSSNDDSNHQWNLNQSISNVPSRSLMIVDSVSISDGVPIGGISLSECEICLEEVSIENLACCSSSICCECISFHLSYSIKEGRIRIICPSCPHIFTREQIFFFLSQNDLNEELSERYRQFYSDINGQSHMKTCPRCSSIKEIDQNLLEGIRWKEKIPRKVFCNECQFQWCFFCHAPWHEKINCKEYQKGEKMLRSWAIQIDENQHNAQKCPRCKIYISRNGGCPHMICSKCQCDFCYNCGRRRLNMKFFGSHESRFSPLGCKFNFYPNKPILRYTVRGLIAGIATLALPVAALGAVALLAVGTTICAPTYGTYRLIKHIRSQRQEYYRTHQMRRISKQWTTNNTLSTYINDVNERDDHQRPIEASLITYREEKDMKSYPIRHRTYFNRNDDDDDDDSSDE